MYHQTNYKSLGHRKILVVDDIEMNQQLAKHIMQSWGFTVDVAANGKEAVEKVEKNSYDLVLMDIQMPEMDGYEATRSIRKMDNAEKRDVPIIAMTAHAMSGEAEKCKNAGMNDYISKPFDIKNLHSKIISALKQKPPFTNMSPNGTY